MRLTFIHQKKWWRNGMILFLTAGLVSGGAAWAGPPMQKPGGQDVMPGHIYRNIPDGHQTVRVGSDRYFFHKGVYYHHRPGGYQAVRPPRGTVIHHLPNGFDTLVVAGLTYFLLAGVYYQKNDTGYVVVEPPPETDQGAASSPAAEGARISVIVPLLNLRSGPGKAHPVVSQLSLGTRMVIAGHAPDWYYVRLPDGTFGWVMSVYTRALDNGARG